MTERERLIEILKVPIYPREGVEPAEVVADYLLSNGVIVPPCKVGDTVYVMLYDYDNSIKVIEDFVTGVFYDEIGFTIFTHRIQNGTIGYDVFLTEEEALKECENK